MRTGFPPGCLPLFAILLLILLLPVFLADLMLTALGKLGLSSGTSLLALAGIFFGSFINIPIQFIDRLEGASGNSSGMYGMERSLFSGMQRPNQILLAMNLGGGIIPLLIAIYELQRLYAAGNEVFLLSLVCVGINIVLCERMAKPIPNRGISINALVPALTAALSALLLVPEQAPATAFAAGVLGPLVGADLLHLRDIQRITTGIASIGGAGTFDGIVLSGLLATLLA